MQANPTDCKGKFSMGMFLVALGIVYGDIGTSPMYVMKSIIEGEQKNIYEFYYSVYADRLGIKSEL